MLQNYLKIAYRNLLRNKVYALLNIVGLAVGIAAALLLFLIVNYELSFDTFQSKYHQIYRIVTEERYPSGNVEHNPGAPIPITEALRLDMPQFKKVAALNASFGSQFAVLGNNDDEKKTIKKKFIEPVGVFFVETTLFDFFEIKWLSGNAKESLKSPNQVVLSKSIAEKYFGTWKNAEGKFLKMDNALNLMVKGIIDDVPPQTNLPFKILISFESFKKNPDLYNYNEDWGSTSSNHQVYVWLPKEENLAKTQKNLDAFCKKHYKENSNSNKINWLQPLKEIHYDTRFGDFNDLQTTKSTIWTLIFIGIVTLVMACINFINLATAQAISRSREVGIRKVLGGYKRQIFGQFMTETTIIVAFAVFISLVIAELTLPFIRQVSNVPENIAFLLNPTIWFFIFCIIILVSLLSGFYPALILSGFDPVQALKNKISVSNIGNISLKRSLVVIQFSISQILIVGTLIAISQMEYIRKIDLGFKKDAVYVTSISTDSLSQRKFEAFKSDIGKISGVKSISLSNDAPSSNNNWSTNFGFDRNSNDVKFNTHLKFADANYFKTYGLEFLAGKAYSPSDTAQSFVINETLMKKLGSRNPQEIVGKLLRLGGGKSAKWKPIVGVVRDFKVNSVREEIKPIVISPRTEVYFRAGISLEPTNLKSSVNQIQQIWEKYFSDYVFDGRFLDEQIAEFYIQENQLAKVYQIFAGLAIFISCLGLYGLISFLTVQKSKEIGIRKVLGASITHLVGLLTKDFMRLVFISLLISTPIAYYLMSQWLQNFVYRIEISWISFVIAGMLAASVAMLTMSYQAIKAALANPVNTLKDE